LYWFVAYVVGSYGPGEQGMLELHKRNLWKGVKTCN